MNRLFSISRRIAAGPFPITDDMRAFVTECLARIAVLAQHVNNDVSGNKVRKRKRQDEYELQRLYNGLDVMIQDRVVQGPYGRQARIKLLFQVDSYGHGATYSEPPNSTGGVPVFNILMNDVFFDMENPKTGEKLARVDWTAPEGRSRSEEMFLHELIHCFDPRAYDRRLWDIDESNTKYLDRPIEKRAFEGSMRANVEVWRRQGVGRDEAMNRVRALSFNVPGHVFQEKPPSSRYQPLPGRSEPAQQYDDYATTDPTRKKDVLTRYYKIVDQVYSAPLPPQKSKRVKKDVVPLSTSTPLPLPG